MFHRIVVLLSMLASLAATATSAQSAEAWPARPIRFVVSFPPGGPTDAIARAIADQLRPVLGQPIVVDNKPGAGGNLGIADAVRNGKDGHTLMLLTTTTSAINPHLYSALGYDEREVMPVSIVARQTYTLLVRNGVPTNLRDLLAAVRSKPNAFTAATGNATSLVANHMLQKAAGGEILSVPYKGDADALNGLMGGQTDMYFTVSPQLAALVEAGKLKAVAVAGTHRNPALPNVPTFAESGLPDFFELSVWYGVATHANVPADVVERLNREINKIVASPEFRARLKSMVAEPVTLSAREASAFVRGERARWQDPIKASGATVQ